MPVLSCGAAGRHREILKCFRIQLPYMQITEKNMNEKPINNNTEIHTLQSGNGGAADSPNEMSCTAQVKADDSLQPAADGTPQITADSSSQIADGTLQTSQPSRVAVVKCSTYDEQAVQNAVQRAIDLLGGIESILAGDGALNHSSRIVLKPNLLARTGPDKACTTHPAVFKAAGAILQKAGYTNLRYGDSPGNPMYSVERVAQECGIKAAADSLKIPLGEFESGTQVDFPQGRAAESFVLCNEIIKADAVINVCKMKTHQLERITGAVKNTFGCVYGVNKAASHAKFATAETFAKMIADLNNLVRPRLHIMDGIIAMEGNGPQSGTPAPMGVILASTDPVALDAVFCHLVNLRPELVPTNVSGMEQGVGTWQNLEITDESGIITPEEALRRYGSRTFSVQRGTEYRGMLKPIRFLAPLLEKRPIMKKERCVGCGICVNACPVEGKAIHIMQSGTECAGADWNSGSDSSQKIVHGSSRKTTPGGNTERTGRRVAVYDYSKCIKCYCCQEMCPQEAITVKKSLLARIADRKWRI